METQTQTNHPNKRQRRGHLSDEEETDSLSFPRFLVASAKNEQPIKFNIFAIQKLIQCGVGDVKSAKKLRNGSVLIEVLSKAQATKALAMQTWIDTEITVTPHRSLNSSRGVVRCRDFRDCTDEEVLAALQSQGVTELKHLMKKRADTVEPTNTFVLTFNTPTPPKDIRAAYMKIDVEPYIPNPLRCFKCQRFGHGKSSCNRNAVCARCGLEGHEDSGCQATHHCANCSGNHPAYSRECPTWCIQRDITKVKTEKNISFFEARKIVEKQTITSSSVSSAPGGRRAGVSYSHATTKPLTTTASAQTQTDFTWPLTSKVPVWLHTPMSADGGSQTESPTRHDDGAADTRQSPPEAQNAKKKQTSSDNLNLKQTNRKPGPATYRSSSNKRINPTKTPKGSNDPIQIFNRFGSLDNMELEMNRSPSPRARSKQKTQQNG